MSDDDDDDDAAAAAFISIRVGVSEIAKGFLRT